MPRDNHPRERQARALARKKPRRPTFDRALIVTEGSKTEPLYFEDIRQKKSISSVHIDVIPSIGTEPTQIVDYAIKKFKETREFERIYAVFDRDDHKTYQDALQKAAWQDNQLKNSEGQKVRFFAIPSVPCFELWLLLHYQDLFAFSHRSEVINRVGAHIKDYAKGMKGIYARTEPHISAATKRAAHLRGRFNAASGNDPYTDADQLVDWLRSLKSGSAP